MRSNHRRGREDLWYHEKSKELDVGSFLRELPLAMKEGGVYVNQQHGSHVSFGTDTDGLFLLAALSAVVVYLAAPSVYTNLLMLHPTPTDRYLASARLSLVGILLVIAVGMVGVMQHWRWLFWLLLIAFGASILDIPVTILQMMGALPSVFPVWYSLFRMGVALVEVALAVWMIHLNRHHGVWAMGKKHTRP